MGPFDVPSVQTIHEFRRQEDIKLDATEVPLGPYDMHTSVYLVYPKWYEKLDGEEHSHTQLPIYGEQHPTTAHIEGNRVELKSLLVRQFNVDPGMASRFLTPVRHAIWFSIDTLASLECLFPNSGRR